jgi:glycerophosphoryl diester phosphodiesterase
MDRSIVKQNVTGSMLLLWAVIFGFNALAVAQVQPSAGAAGEPGNPYIIGHRGAAGLLPENTVAAFRRACELGVDGVELDVLVSADGELVVHHDYRLKPEIARTPDGTWVSSSTSPAIKDLTLAQLKAYDVGRLQPKTSYAARYPEQTPVEGERIPTLKQVIQLFKTACAASTRLLIEIKTSPEDPALTSPPEAVVDKVAALVRAEGITERVLVISFDWRSLVHIQKTAPGVATAYLTMVGGGLNNLKPGQLGTSPWTAGIDVDDFSGSAPKAVKAAGGRIWSPYFKNLTAESLAEARQLGLAVYVWTVDQPEDMNRMIKMKVDGITTNRPDILKKLVNGQ